VNENSTEEIGGGLAVTEDRMDSGPKLVVTIDGPAASGKSTTARLVAESLGYVYLDTGAMYRAITWKALRDGVDLGDGGALAELAQATTLDLKADGNKTRVLVDGADVSDDVRAPNVTAGVSQVSAFPQVREVLVLEQRRIGASGGVVVEGRDIGTVVFPDAEVKVYLTATLDERSERRQREYSQGGTTSPLEDIRDQLALRDEKDSSREASPLKKPEDASVVDNTDLTVQEQVEAVLAEVRRAWRERVEAPVAGDPGAR